MKYARVAALFAAASAVPAHAGDIPLYQPAPAWVQAAPVVVKKKGVTGPVLVVLDRQVRIEQDRTWAYNDTVVSVDSPEALTQLGQLSGAWMPDKGDLIIHRAEILRDGETIDLLAGGDRFEVLRRETQLEQRALSGLLTATMPVKGLRVGDMLRLNYSITERDAALGGKVQAVLQTRREEPPVAFSRLQFSWPVGTPAKWKAGPRIDIPADAVTTSGGWQTLTVREGKADAAMPDDAPLRYRRPPLVQVTTFAGWGDVSQTMAALFATEGLIEADPKLVAEVETIAAAHADPLHRAAAALELVQGKISYLLLGMDGGNYVPQTPSQTWALRYGDCKAKSLLLLAMLRKLGIEAEAVLVQTTISDAVPDLLPAPADFDHVIVRARIDRRDLWLDGTRSGGRLATIDDVPAFRYALPLRPEGADLMPIEWRAAASPQLSARIELDASAGVDFPMPFDVMFEAGGDLGALLHSADGQATKTKRDEMLAQISRGYLPGALVSDASMAWLDDTGTAMIRVRGLAWGNWVFERGGTRLPFRFGMEDLIFSPDRARPAWRGIPVLTRGPGSALTTASITLPDGGKGFTVTGDAEYNDTVAGIQVARTTTIADGVLRYRERNDLTGAEITGEALAAEKARAAQTVARLPQLSGPAAIQRYWQVPAKETRTRFAAIERSYAAALARDPGSATVLADRGRFRTLGGDLKGALADYSTAIAKEPSAALYASRAWVHDAMGDAASAAADLALASELEPADDGVASAQALAMAKAGKLDDALSLVEDRIVNGGKDTTGLYPALAELLSRAGRAEEAVDRLGQELLAHPGNPQLLNALCWTRGTMNLAPELALRDCTRAIELSDSPAAALDSRGMVLFRLGRTDEALADLDAALEAVPGLSGTLFLRGVVRQKASIAGAAEDIAAARRIQPGIDGDYKRFGIVPAS